MSSQRPSPRPPVRQPLSQRDKTAISPLVNRNPTGRQPLVTNPGSPPKPYRELATIAVSVVVLASALFIILAPGYDASRLNWAIGAVAGISGYWLRGEVSSRKR